VIKENIKNNFYNKKCCFICKKIFTKRDKIENNIIEVFDTSFGCAVKIHKQHNNFFVGGMDNAI
jgi:hypothetical protein